MIELYTFQKSCIYIYICKNNKIKFNNKDLKHQFFLKTFGKNCDFLQLNLLFTRFNIFISEHTLGKEMASDA